MVQPEHLIVDPEIIERCPDLVVVTRIVSDVEVRDTTAELESRKNLIIKQWEGKSMNDLNTIPSILMYRTLHKQLEAGDNNFLPSVEGMLVRAILKGKFPKINSIVDVGNVVSLEHMVPIGLFDADHIKGKPVLDLAGSNETIVAIGKESPLPVPAGTPVLRDDEKIISIIGVRDSKFTMITPQTKKVLVFSWGLGEGQKSILNRALESIT